jgi:creatinine amidohydrolase
MSNQVIPQGLLPTNLPDLFFEDNEVGRMKKQVWDASDAEIDAILAEYGVPSPVEWGKPGSYIQTTVRWQVEANRKKNDIVFIPVGCTELHGRHLPSASDTLYVSQICEGVRRFTAKRGAVEDPRQGAVNLALPPLNYGGHPYHHVGMPGTVIVREHVVREMMIDVMLGLWNDGFRKQLIVNNHGQLWMLESAVQEFQKRYQLPGIFRVIDWHRGVREFFRATDRGGRLDTNFVHADESETSLGLLLHPDMVDMNYAVDTEGKSYLPDGHFDKSVDPFGRPSRWSEGEGHFAIEIAATPEGVVGKSTHGAAEKAKRPVAAILKYLTLWNDHVLAAFPPGVVPPVEEVTLRSAAEMEPYLREPLSPGWKPVYALPRIGQGTEV